MITTRSGEGAATQAKGLGSRLARGVEIAALLSGLGGQRLLSLVAIPLVLRRYGSSVTATIVVIEAFTIYLQVVLPSGGATLSQRFLRLGDIREIRRTWSTTALLTLIGALLGSAGVTVVAPSHSYLWYLGIAAAASMAVSPSWVARYERRFGLLAAINGLQTGITVVATLVGLVVAGPAWYFCGPICGSLIATSIWCIHNGISVPRLNGVRDIILFGGSQVAIQIYTSMDIVLVQTLLGTRATAIYGALSKLQSLLLGLYGVLTQFLLPRVLGATEHETYRIGDRLVVLAGSGILSMSIVLWAIGGHLPFPWNTHTRLALVLATQVALAVAFIPGSLFLNQVTPVRLLRAVTTGAVINLVLNAILLPAMGLWATAVASIAAEGIMVIAAIRVWGYRPRTKSAIFGAGALVTGLTLSVFR